MDKRFYLSFDKLVGYWNNEQGAGVKADGTRDDSRWGVDISHADGFVYLDGRGSHEIEDEQELLLFFIMNTFFLRQELEAEDIRIMDDGRLTFSIIEDGDGNDIFNTEFFSKNNPSKQLYICDYSFTLEVHEVTTPSKEELNKMFSGFQT